MPPLATAVAPGSLTLLAADLRRTVVDVTRTVTLDRPRRGAVAIGPRTGVVRRAEPSSAGPLLIEARPESDGVALEVWGPAAVPAEAREQALAAAGAWVGLDDHLDGFADAVSGHPLLRELSRRLGEVRLSRLPRLGEALGRAIIGQLVQGIEAARSTAQVAALAGTPAPGGLWCWPTPEQLLRTPSWALRRCGVSLRSARALQSSAFSDHRLREAGTDWALLDQRLRALPGVGVWTSGVTRLALGDPDAVPIGDWGLPGLIGHVLGGAGRDNWDDAAMLELLAPFAGHRGRAIEVVKRAVSSRMVSGPRRRAPRAALSAHRYW
ncbi:MAG TPA: hypothetical protein VML96_12060 [Egibacteraceae bacterium]|nr:hypothetical protein [Egibacteraceae bacterium]